MRRLYDKAGLTPLLPVARIIMGRDADQEGCPARMASPHNTRAATSARGGMRM